jgi:hypothetical protein
MTPERAAKELLQRMDATESLIMFTEWLYHFRGGKK